MSGLALNSKPIIKTMSKVCILDYGSGNTKSVFNLFNAVSPDVIISNRIEDIQVASHIVLPGVGAFGASMHKINEVIPMPTLKEAVFEKRTPFLGICVGMQVLADIGHEFEEHQGLGWISGEIKKLDSSGEPLPHVGWNSIQKVKDSRLLQGIEDGSDFYFVHSYAFSPVEEANVVSRTTYGESFCSVIEAGNVHGVQFHPEKSHVAGKLLCENFLNLG